jgi:hypothetical protein
MDNANCGPLLVFLAITPHVPALAVVVPTSATQRSAAIFANLCGRASFNQAEATHRLTMDLALTRCLCFKAYTYLGDVLLLLSIWSCQSSPWMRWSFYSRPVEADLPTTSFRFLITVGGGSSSRNYPPPGLPPSHLQPRFIIAIPLVKPQID